MKTFLKWNSGLALVAALSASVAAQEPPPAGNDNLVNAQGQLVSDQKPLPASIGPGTPAAEVVKLAQAGVDESVMLAYVANSGNLFNLTSESIVYLNDIGVPGPVVTAMIQYDQTWKTGAAGSAPPPTQTITAQASSALPAQSVPMDQLPAQENASYSYFYDSLTPYGNWIDVEGYGMCWQPTTVVVNAGWQPYSDHGHWIDTDSGWYWMSDYSWGWAAFHYGRWFRHDRWGWCWAPDTVWGPSWVSWRQTEGYCGWAPLPPAAVYRPGFGFSYFGRSVGFGFDFGLSFNSYAFVPIDLFCDPHPWRHRLPRERVTQIFNTTVVVNNFSEGHDHHVINHGIPVDRVAAASHTPIHRISIQETSVGGRNLRGEQLEAGGRSIAVYRPQLPQPTQTKSPFVGGGVRAATHTEIARPASEQRAFTPRPSAPNNNERRTENPQPQQRNQPVIIRGQQNNGGRNAPGSANRPDRSSANPAPAERTFPRSTLNQNPQQVTTPPLKQGASPQTQTPMRSYNNFNSAPSDSGRVQRQQPNVERQQQSPRVYSPRYESQMPQPSNQRQYTPPASAPPANSYRQQESRPSPPPQQASPPAQSDRSSQGQGRQDKNPNR